MEDIVSIMGALTGAIGVIASISSRFVRSRRNRKVTITLLGDKHEIAIDDIEHLSDDEIKQIIEELSDKVDSI